ncbi:MAG: LD-carboxypeptidase [Thermodesulfobacteriota bacterium]|nr:LD-carboxypeptidase [Thermodesulfobacteriota bacterium]
MESLLLKPLCLGPGDTIGIAAPASPFNQEAFEAGVGVLESMGFTVKVPESLFKRRGYLAGSDAERAALLMDLFGDETVRAILCARGGFGSMRLLPRLDLEKIRRQRKIVVGFSDVTALLVALYKKCGLVTFHGPMVTTLGKGLERTSSALMAAISSQSPLVLSPSRPVVLNPGQASGPVIGGNLTTLSHLMGTPFEPVFRGHLLFLEDRGEAPYRIDRMLSQLQLGGHIDTVAGVILGSFEDCGPLEEVYDMVRRVFQKRPIPVLAGFDIGHGTDNMTLPLGLQADLDTVEGTLRFKESAVMDGE